jgi:tetratricopeptide (TPR) repeat protein
MFRSRTTVWTGAAFALATLALSACSQPNSTSKTQAQPAAQAAAEGQLPEGHPPMGSAPFMGGGMKDADGPLDDHSVALKQTGLNSAAELTTGLEGLSDAELRSAYEMAFRYSFSARVAQRNYPEAVNLANKVVSGTPNFAPAYRVLGYALFNTGRQNEALAAYQKAVQIDPNYGEAHYALAFMFAMGDRTQGGEHYRKAMALGIPDERDLGGRFYSQAQ